MCMTWTPFRSGDAGFELYKVIIQNFPPLLSFSSLSLSIMSDSEVYEVEAIIKHRGKVGRQVQKIPFKLLLLIKTTVVQCY
jgi:hypothetical protein